MGADYLKLKWEDGRICVLAKKEKKWHNDPAGFLGSESDPQKMCYCAY